MTSGYIVIEIEIHALPRLKCIYLGFMYVLNEIFELSPLLNVYHIY